MNLSALPYKDSFTALCEAARRRVLILDGAMGTMVMNLGLTENDFRGDRFADHPLPLSGCNDILSITQPDKIMSVHRAYLDAGADIVETNSSMPTVTLSPTMALTTFREKLHSKRPQ